MSRAFVDESDAQYGEEDVPEIRSPLPPGARNYMTPAGAERLQEELRELVSSERPRVAAAVARLTSGAEAADPDQLTVQRRRLREIDRRIEYLTGMAARLEVIDPAGQDPDRVVFGATVTVAEPGGGEKTYQIVGVDEAEPEAGRVSWISPVARALTGARVGQEVRLSLPAGETRLRVLRVR